MFICSLGIYIHLVSFGLWCRDERWQVCAWSSGCLVVIQKTLGFILKTTAASTHSHTFPAWNKFWESLSLDTESVPVSRTQSHNFSWTNYLGQETANHSPRANCLFLLIKFSWNTVTPTDFWVLPMAALMLQWQSWVVVTEPGWLRKSKIFIVWTLLEKGLLTPGWEVYSFSGCHNKTTVFHCLMILGLEVWDWGVSRFLLSLLLGS